MARTFIAQALCDLCDHLGLHNIPAHTPHVIKLDSGPLKEHDHCDRCEKAIAWFLDYLRDHGQEVEPPQPKQPKTKTVHAPQPKELEKPRQYVLCPLPHAAEHGQSKRVAYTDRGTHADIVHDGAKLWEITWEDPDNILTHPCDVHAECMKTHLAFSSARGLAQHRYSSPLPRIDHDEPDE